MKEIRIVFDGPPGPEAGRFVEVETEQGRSISFGEWREGEGGYWYLVLPEPFTALAASEARCRELEESNRILFNANIKLSEERNEVARDNAALRERLKAVEEKYSDLIMQVGKKFTGESRHETAKRYIRERENATCESATGKAAYPVKGE